MAWVPSGVGDGAALPQASVVLTPADVTGVAHGSVEVEAAQVTRVFFAGAAVTMRLRHWLRGAQTP